VWAWIRAIASAADLEQRGAVYPHRLRHTFLAEVNDETGDIRVTQELAGHADPNCTMIYTRATERKKRAAIDSLSYNRRTEDSP
jgi:integrase/recombinase XerC